MARWLISVLAAFSFSGTVFSALNSNEEEVGVGRYVIEGRVFPPDELADTNWQVDMRIHINGGEHIGFVRKDGTFVVHNVPSGSYVVEILHPDYLYEPVRVEINSKGKYRARRVNYIQTSQVIQVPYPLRAKPSNRARYFQMREQWRLTDFLFNPMIIMMVLPLLLIMVLPKMMNDPETKEEFKQIGNLTRMGDMPEMSEMMTSLFGGGAPKSAAGKAKSQVKKKQ